MSARRILLVLGLSVMAAIAAAEQYSAVTLKIIMQDLRYDTVKIFDALLTDDFAVVAETAERIADHPKIPDVQVSRVVAELGPEMAAFKQFDMRVHDAAAAMRSAALHGDRAVMQRSFQDMTNGCLACHAAYRQRVKSALESATSKVP